MCLVLICLSLRIFKTVCTREHLVFPLAFATFSSFELSGVKDTAVVAAKYPYITAYLKHHEGVRTYALSTSPLIPRAKPFKGIKTGTILTGRVTKEGAQGLGLG